MFDAKRLAAIGRHAALICAALLLVVACVSSGRTSEVDGRLTVQVLRQAMGFRAQHLRRAINAQTRASNLERSEATSNRSSVGFGASTPVATLHAWQACLRHSYRELAPFTFDAVERLRTLQAVDVERARAPPKSAAFTA